MNKKMLPLIATVALAIGSPVQAQESADDVYTQRLTYVKTLPGKAQEWRQLQRDTSMKVAQMHADSGEIISWTLLRSVYPSGQEARANFLISVISAGSPKSRARSIGDDLKMAGVEMSSYEVQDKRGELSSLVAVELWRPRIYDGAAEKGNYLTLNMMKVKDSDLLAETTSTWSGLSKEWIKKGAMTGWIFATKILPNGTETPYGAYSSDMYPTMEAAFAGRNARETFAKVYPGKTWDDFGGKLGKARSIAKREMWVVAERITKSK